MLHQIQQLVQFGIVAAFEQAPICDNGGRAVDQGRAEQSGAVVQMVPGFDDAIETLGQFMTQRLRLGGVMV